MGLKGAAIGGIAGWLFGRSPLGAILGAIFGNSIEESMQNGGKTSGGRSRGSAADFQSEVNPRKQLIFCASAAAMLAKLAKADGVVTQREIAAVERSFARLGFSQLTRQYAVNAFRKAKDDRHTIYEYAYNFASAVRSVQIRELLYELLWDVACADGRIGPGELEILRKIPLSLGIRASWFEYFARERIAGYASNGGCSGGAANSGNTLDDAYELLGASPSDTDAVLKKKYRDLAKKYHPDALRAQGLPDEMIGKANERMSKINAAWSQIKSDRGL